jgi:hypothetical protein
VIEFGATSIEIGKEIELTITSCSDEALLEIYNINIKNESSSDFDIDYSKLSTGVKPALENPLIILPKYSEIVGVTYYPHKVGSKNNPDTGTIEIECNTFEMQIEVPVSGWGI